MHDEVDIGVLVRLVDRTLKQIVEILCDLSELAISGLVHMVEQVECHCQSDIVQDIAVLVVLPERLLDDLIVARVRYGEFFLKRQTLFACVENADLVRFKSFDRCGLTTTGLSNDEIDITHLYFPFYSCYNE